MPISGGPEIGAPGPESSITSICWIPGSRHAGRL